jgi:hypothetical protein
MKKERFGVAVEPGILEKLREMAGGERKIGEFLSYLVDREWVRRSALVDDAPGEEMETKVIARAELEKRIRDQDAEIQELDKIIGDMAQRMRHQNRDLSYFRAVVESAKYTREYTFEEYQALRKSQREATSTPSVPDDQPAQD